MGWSAGTYYPDYNWTLDEENNVPLLASRFQDQLDKLCLDGISATWKRDGSNVPTQNLNMASHKFTNVTEAEALAEFAVANQIIRGQLIWVDFDQIGQSGVYSGDLPIAPAQYTKGMVIACRFDTPFLSSVTPYIFLNNLGNREIVDAEGDKLDSGSLTQTAMYIAIFNGQPDTGVWHLINVSSRPFRGTTISASYNSGQVQILSSSTLNDMLLGWQDTEISNVRYVRTLSSAPNTGLEPQVPGIYRVVGKLTSYGTATQDGYLGIGSVLRAPGELVVPDAAQIDYRYFKGGTGMGGAGGYASSQYIYKVTQSDIDNGKYFPFFGIWSRNSGSDIAYIDENYMSAEYLGED